MRSCRRGLPLALSAYGALLPGALASPTVSIMDRPSGHGCCRTEFYVDFLNAVQRHPGYRENPEEADILIPSGDSLRQCWSLKKVSFNDCVAMEDGGRRLDERQDRQLRFTGFDTADNELCDWCCHSSPEEFIRAVHAASNRFGPGKTFVYFKNNQDTAFTCGEFEYAKVAIGSLVEKVRFAGINLQVSQLGEPVNSQDRNSYEIPGINLLVPLHPTHQKIVMDDDARDLCDFTARDLRASFSGHLDPEGLRKRVFDLQGMPGTEQFHLYETKDFGEQNGQMGYEMMLRRSKFCYVPRGDEHYSFRLTEVVAAGCVPVLIDDDFLPPFGMSTMKDWAIMVPESDIASSIKAINSVSDSEFCSFQRNATRIWQYARDLDGMVAGLLDGLSRPPTPIRWPLAIRPVVSV